MYQKASAAKPPVRAPDPWFDGPPYQGYGAASGGAGGALGATV